MANKPIPNRKRTTKLERRIHNEKVQLKASFQANSAIALWMGGALGSALAATSIEDSSKQTALFLVASLLLIGGRFVRSAGFEILDTLVDD